MQFNDQLSSLHVKADHLSEIIKEKVKQNLEEIEKYIIHLQRQLTGKMDLKLELNKTNQAVSIENTHVELPMSKVQVENSISTSTTKNVVLPNHLPKLKKKENTIRRKIGI